MFDNGDYPVVPIWDYGDPLLEDLDLTGVDGANTELIGISVSSFPPCHTPSSSSHASSSHASSQTSSHSFSSHKSSSPRASNMTAVWITLGAVGSVLIVVMILSLMLASKKALIK